MFAQLLEGGVGCGDVVLRREGLLKRWKCRAVELRGDPRHPTSEPGAVAWSLLYSRTFKDEKDVRGVVRLGAITAAVPGGVVEGLCGGVPDEGLARAKATWTMCDETDCIVELKDRAGNSKLKFRTRTELDALRWRRTLRVASSGACAAAVAAAWADSGGAEPPTERPRRKASAVLNKVVQAVRKRLQAARYSHDPVRCNLDEDRPRGPLARAAEYVAEAGAPPAMRVYRITLKGLTGLPILEDIFCTLSLVDSDGELRQTQRSSIIRVSEAHVARNPADEAPCWVPAEAFDFKVPADSPNPAIVLQICCREGAKARAARAAATGLVGAVAGAAVSGGFGAPVGFIIGATIGGNEFLDRNKLHVTTINDLCDGLIRLKPAALAAAAADAAEEAADAAEGVDPADIVENDGGLPMAIALHDSGTGQKMLSRNRAAVLRRGTLHIAAGKRHPRTELAALVDVHVFGEADKSRMSMLDVVWEHERRKNFFAKGTFAPAYLWSKGDPAHYASVDYAYRGASFESVAPTVPRDYRVARDWHQITVPGSTHAWQYATEFPRCARGRTPLAYAADRVSRGAVGGGGGAIWWAERKQANCLQVHNDARVRRRAWARLLVYDPGKTESCAAADVAEIAARRKAMRRSGSVARNVLRVLTRNADPAAADVVTLSAAEHDDEEAAAAAAAADRVPASSYNEGVTDAALAAAASNGLDDSDDSDDDAESTPRSPKAHGAPSDAMLARAAENAFSDDDASTASAFSAPARSSFRNSLDSDDDDDDDDDAAAPAAAVKKGLDSDGEDDDDDAVAPAVAAVVKNGLDSDGDDDDDVEAKVNTGLDSYGSDAEAPDAAAALQTSSFKDDVAFNEDLDEATLAAAAARNDLDSSDGESSSGRVSYFDEEARAPERRRTSSFNEDVSEEQLAAAAARNLDSDDDNDDDAHFFPPQPRNVDFVEQPAAERRSAMQRGPPSLRSLQVAAGQGLDVDDNDDNDDDDTVATTTTRNDEDEDKEY
ncbi:hypothetical protein M885DRAFT_548148 [Pelagophyceae sp. CCMP2097]|nr:hypothetical protein M885DRAFT_548148 [Pelagophyceae sp. CCMP2097]